LANDSAEIVFTSVYSIGQDSAHFSVLKAMYDHLESEEACCGLVSGLKHHYQMIREKLGADFVESALLGSGLDEWDLIMLSWVYEEKGDGERYIKYLEAASEMFPESFDAKTNLAEAYVENGRVSDGERILEDLLKGADVGSDRHKLVQKKLSKIRSSL